jgi:hypothetical protein
VQRQDRTFVNKAPSYRFFVKSRMADESITEAVDRLGGCVTAAEVAIETGISVDQCEDELRALMVSILSIDTFGELARIRHFSGLDCALS